MGVHEVHSITQEDLGGRLVTSQPVSKEQSQALWIQVNYELSCPGGSPGLKRIDLRTRVL